MLLEDKTYQIVVFLLYISNTIDNNFKLTHDNIGTIEMSDSEGFFLSVPHPDAQPASSEPVMINCNVATNIIGRGGSPIYQMGYL